MSLVNNSDALFPDKVLWYELKRVQYKYSIIRNANREL